MINPSEIDNILSEDYEGSRMISPSKWAIRNGEAVAGDWEPVEYAEELVYDVIHENRTVKAENCTIEGIERGGVMHDGGEIYEVVKVIMDDGETETFVRFGRYSSWDSDYFDGDWVPGEAYEYTETRWKARK